MLAVTLKSLWRHTLLTIQPLCQRSIAMEMERNAPIDRSEAILHLHEDYTNLNYTLRTFQPLSQRSIANCSHRSSAYMKTLVT